VGGDETTTDSELFAAVAAGDAQVFAVLFDRHADAVHAFCRRHAPEGGDADDLLSLTFLEAWRSHRRAFVVEGSLYPWLAGIARHVCAHARRSSARHSAALKRYAATGTTDAPDSDIADRSIERIDAARLSTRLAAAIDTLSADELAVYTLCIAGEASVEHAARVLGLPVGTVKTRVARCKKRVRRSLRSGELQNQTPGTGHSLSERSSIVPTGG
jgi:RNA polymerase sigma factor (sigma-70 family)